MLTCCTCKHWLRPQIIKIKHGGFLKGPGSTCKFWSDFDLTNSINTAHAQCFNAAYHTKTFDDQRVVCNMAVDKHFHERSICISYMILSINVDVILKSEDYS